VAGAFPAIITFSFPASNAGRDAVFESKVLTKNSRGKPRNSADPRKFQRRGCESHTTTSLPRSANDDLLPGVQRPSPQRGSGFCRDGGAGDNLRVTHLPPGANNSFPGSHCPNSSPSPLFHRVVWVSPLRRFRRQSKMPGRSTSVLLSYYNNELSGPPWHLYERYLPAVSTPLVPATAAEKRPPERNTNSLRLSSLLHRLRSKKKDDNKDGPQQQSATQTNNMILLRRRLKTNTIIINITIVVVVVVYLRSHTPS